ncbi:hypothetical protein D3C75_1219490 [compost metagenome]
MQPLWVFFEQGLERLQNAALRGFERLRQQPGSLRVTALREQQGDPLAQGADGQQHPATDQASFDQPRQALNRRISA